MFENLVVIRWLKYKNNSENQLFHIFFPDEGYIVVSPAEKFEIALG